ncbi:MAG: asparagine synthase (glutamine-hydrolyzing) [Bacteroidota bacterium]
MCGICGIISLDQGHTAAERAQWVGAMNEALLHRGPDEGGEYANPQAHLAMRRLSIIDEAGGQQPIYNEDRSICIVYNGELYNFQELKGPLLDKGHRFYTRTDTEVVVHLYEEKGSEMLPMLKGMFAFCLYDQKKNKYLLARDRFGEKPLYYYWDGQRFAFSSEVKSLLECPLVERRLNHKALPYYFRTSLVPDPLTLLENVYSLPPGHFLELTANGLREGTYFQPSYPSHPSIQTEQEAVERLRPLLEQAVRRQTVSDVPIGAFLSGGIDSSSVVALLQSQSSEQIKTFNVRFEHQPYDESAIARKVAAHCGTEHHEISIPDFDFDEQLFWEIVDHVGLPFRDSSAIPSYLISKEISRHIKVALSGDGGDELFGGYSLFQWYQKILSFKKVNLPLRQLVNSGLGLAQKVPGLSQSSLLRKLKRGLATSLEPVEDIPIALNQMFSQEQVVQLLNHAIPAVDYPLLKDYFERTQDCSSLRRIMYYRLCYTLPANMLIKIDRMSMANSLEVRAPFLDPDLYEASLELPDHLLVQGGLGKYAIRKIMEKDLPAEVFNHPKTGFNIPLFKYQNESFRKLAHRLLFEENPWPGLVPDALLKRIYQEGITAQKNTANKSVFQATHQLWMMMQLFGWAKRFRIQC